MSLLTGSWMLDAVLVLAPLLYWYATRNYGFWKRLGVPYMKPTPFVGNMGGVVTTRQHLGDPIYDCYREAGDRPFMGMFAFDQPLLVVKDPELVGRVLATDFSSFYKLNFTFGENQGTSFETSLFSVHGPRWKALRSKLTPGFTSGKMKRMFQLVDECGRDLVDHIDAAIKKGSSIEVKELMACYTTDAVISSFMGLKAGSLQDSNAPLRQNLKSMIPDNFMARLGNLMAFVSPKLIDILHIQVGSLEAEKFVTKTAEETVEYRKKNGVVREDAIDLLMKLMEDSDGGQPSKERADGGEVFKFGTRDMAGQILSFLIAGYETSASTLIFTLYELALNQQLQERLRLQVKQVAARHDGKITYEGLAEMTDLNNTISETLRVYPVVNFLDRRSTQDYQIPGTTVVIPKDTAIFVSVLGLHYDPRYWQQPHRFDPDRFKEENAKGRPSYTYLPFGDGPRQCIGMRLGLMQVRLGLAHILNNFHVSPTSRTPVPLPLDTTNFILRPQVSLPLNFQRLVSA